MAEQPLVGAFIGLAAAIAAIPVGLAIIGSRLADFTAAARLGISGLLGFGVIGTLVFLVGLITTGTLIQIASLVGIILSCYFARTQLRTLDVKNPTNATAWLLFVAIVLLVLLRVPAALSPSLGWDWDSISHQLAMAKIWIHHGKVDYIDFMHQSNIPATSNMLYMLVLPFGGQFAAKTLALFFGIFSALAVGGITERRYGKNSGWWAALAIFAAPVLLWELGTAYVDVFHGGCFAVSALLATLWLERRADKGLLWISAVFMAIALATKYTAIQSGGALGIALAIVGAAEGIRSALLVGVVGLLLASPWYIRNVINTGNPVYPFFYSVFKGLNWSEANAAAYSAEQQSFGIGQIVVDGEYKGKDPAALPGSIAALAMRPDRQINLGAPFGAVGPIVLLGFLWWPLSGLRGSRAFEKTLVLTALITLVSWFFLTQQSRYIISLIIMGAPLLGGAITALPLKKLLALGVSIQAVYTGYLFAQMPLNVSGKESLDASFEFYPETKRLNEIRKTESVNVALYDEVRGYYLDVPYFWANPGHHTLLPYDSYDSPRKLIDGLKFLGTTHVVLSMRFLGVDESGEIVRAYFEDQFADFQHTQKFRQQLILAHREGLMETVDVFSSPSGAVRSFVFRIR